MDDLESTPDHATLRTSHAANEHAGIVLDLLRDEHARLGGAGGERAVHRASKARGTRVTEFLNGTPRGEARIARLAFDTVRVVAGVLVEWHGAGKVIGANDIATATAVVFAEVPRESTLADGTSFGRLIRLEEESVSQGIGNMYVVYAREECACAGRQARARFGCDAPLCARVRP
jgi:hypothetical protein